MISDRLMWWLFETSEGLTMRPSDYLHQIASNGGAVASHIGELAGAEMKSSAKGLGIGSGLFAGAGFFGYTVLKIFGLAFGFLLSWLFWRAGLSVLMSLFLGFVCVGILGLALVVAMAILGKRQFKHVHAPTATISEVKASLGALGPAVADGVKDAEDALAAPKTDVETEAAPKANYVRDPVYLARQRRAQAR